MTNVEIQVELKSQTPLKHGWECGNYTTTIPLDISREDAKAEIEQIVKQIAQQINKEWCAAEGYNVASSDPYKVFRLMSPTRDIDANRYCFSAEYISNVAEIVDNHLAMDVEIDV